jgi:hypothetical protein
MAIGLLQSSGDYSGEWSGIQSVEEKDESPGYEGYRLWGLLQGRIRRFQVAHIHLCYRCPPPFDD